MLRATGAILERQRFDLAALQVFEVGKPWREADAEVAEAIDFCNYYAQEALKLGQPRRHDVAGEENRTEYIPRGATVVIAPWNFPLAILTGMTTAALVTGNTVVMKPAELSVVASAALRGVARGEFSAVASAALLEAARVAGAAAARAAVAVHAKPTLDVMAVG